jgi:hypothetical protein
MRYQVRTADPQTYSRVATVLREEADVILELPRRRTLAVENLAAGLLDKVVKMGATVEPDYQYAVDPIFP